MRNSTEVDVNDPDYDDPIVAEVRKAREEFGAQFEDVAAMARYLRKCERRHPPGKVVDPRAQAGSGERSAR